MAEDDFDDAEGYEDDDDELAADDEGEGEELEDRVEGAGDESGPRRLAAGERQDIEADLVDLDDMRRMFQGQGVKGVVIACPDCGSDHFYDWELLKESLEHMLATGEPRMHEPAYEPRQDQYIQWDYGKGYVDALSDAGLQPAVDIEATACPWCETPIEVHFAFCPRCGRSLGALRLYRELRERGLSDRDVRAMLIRAGFEPF